ncbi:dihydrodipicolinate synthase family protein [Georgenia subflava]|uniref:Dihydrodipicolinate synthase family protein n=1 Tax=Georgenia subflava TaxID=1622177 RepID=A0A6N7EIC1_9MICO|nr:dihydrodipicolinate synthase family protein [Georgenia subflava]MPV36477.1 dihydrodipicolinate synthase family protein [Georgenia subflava]
MAGVLTEPLRSDVLTRRLRSGVVIPAHPLALDDGGAVDLRAQRALTRYYLAAGAHGMAVGVHTSQFELHDDRGLLEEVWRLAASEVAAAGGDALLVAGLTGDTADAVAEAEIAAAAGYQAALLCGWGMAEVTEEALLDRARAVGEVLPTMGFYLQESVGGRRLGRDYWRRLFDLESVVAVKTAPFDRYRTNDVVQTLLEHDRWDDVVVLTGNDDTIVHDLITPYRREVGGTVREVRAAGGLLGQWAVGTRAAVQLLEKVRAATAEGAVPVDLLADASALVDVNAAVFDVDNDFAGCVPGVNEVLRQQGLVRTARCLGPDVLSPGQAELIATVRERHPDLLDEGFVATHVEEWLA